MRVVLDTNVLISAFFWNGNERRILKKCRKKEHQLITSPQILSEMRSVLSSKFDVPAEKIDEYERQILLFSVIVIPEGKINVVDDDPTDNKIVETAYIGKAEIIITGDGHLLKLKNQKRIKIIRAGRV